MNETFIYFNIYNYTGQPSVSSYALPFCGFKFVLDANELDNQSLLSKRKILWDYGDGTTSTELTGSHAYIEPGTYRVTCYLYDINGEAYVNKYTRNVTAYNYITDGISLSTANTQTYNLTAGKINNPILIIRTNSYQSYVPSTQYTIVPFASSGSGTSNYFTVNQKPLYYHLEKYHSFYAQQYAPSGILEFVEISSIHTPSSNIYCKLEGDEIIHTVESDPSSFFCGTSGEQLIYFKDDISRVYTFRSFSVSYTIYYSFNVWFTQVQDIRSLTQGEVYYTGMGDSTITCELAPVQIPGEGATYIWRMTLNPGIVNGISQIPVVVDSRPIQPNVPPWEASWSDYTPAPQFIVNNDIVPTNLYFGFESNVFDVNTSTLGLSCTVYPNNDLNSVSITSNGIDGEGIHLTAFDITSDKFLTQKINFVAKVKDSEWYTIKDVYIVDYDTMLSSYDVGVLSATFTIQSSANGYLKGYVTSFAPSQNVKICTTLTLSTASISSFTIDGCSSLFNITNTVPKIAKRGEDIDMLERYKSLRFQELFLDKINLFDNFLGSIVGTISSEQTSIGKKVHEKISNFVDNNSNIDKCEIPQLVSILQSIGEDSILFEKTNFNYPTSLKRLVDLLSIKHSKLFGARNTFDLDFYNYGNQLLGNNLGDRITNTLSYTITAGHDLVALEKYSDTFKKLNTYLPLSSISLSGAYVSQYPLSAYDDSWGWNLILNEGFTPEDIDKYYIFFNHEQYLNDIDESVINFKDGNTTIEPTFSSYTEWKRDNGTIDNILYYDLAVGLNLIDKLSDDTSFNSLPIATVYPVITSGSLYVSTSAEWIQTLYVDNRWYKNNTPTIYTGGNYTDTLVNGDAIFFRSSAVNAYGSNYTDSNIYTYTYAPPVLITAPIITQWDIGSSSYIAVSASWSNYDTISSQWYLDGVPEPGQTGGVYTGAGMTGSTIFFASSAENADAIITSVSNITSLTGLPLPAYIYYSYDGYTNQI